VGKGSPVWADGKIYVMEVNGNIWTLRPSREGCEVLNHVELAAADGTSGMDEIYASPAIADGRIYFVTRDRTICVGAPKTELSVDPIPGMPPEKETSQEVATLLMVPCDVSLMAGQAAEYELRSFDANGNFINTIPADQITLPEGLPPECLSGQKIVAPDLDRSVAGVITATAGNATATSRIRVYSGEAQWSWDFEGYQPGQVPETWVRAFGKLKPEQVGDGGNMALKSGGMESVRGRPSHLVWIGPPEMKGYTIQADVLFTEQNRRLSSMGINSHRYNFIVKGNNNKIELETWPAHLRLQASKSFRVEPDTWYTMKMEVREEGDTAHIFGKVWKRDEAEPAEWTIDAVDPLPNRHGSPGLYMYSMADSYFDNVIVTQNQP
jgi:hypothetical protein